MTNGPRPLVFKFQSGHWKYSFPHNSFEAILIALGMLKHFLLYVCVCMFTYEDEHTYRYAYAHSCVHGCGGGRTTSGFSTGGLHLAFWDLRQHLSLTWNSSSRLVCLGVPVPVPAFPMLGLQVFIAVLVGANIVGMKYHDQRATLGGKSFLVLTFTL